MCSILKKRFSIFVQTLFILSCFLSQRRKSGFSISIILIKSMSEQIMNTASTLPMACTISQFDEYVCTFCKTSFQSQVLIVSECACISKTPKVVADTVLIKRFCFTFKFLNKRKDETATATAKKVFESAAK